MLEWLNMGKHGAFVWGAYGVALIGLVGLTVWVARSHSRAARNDKASETGL